MAVLGCGRIAQTIHLPALRGRDDVQVVALAEPVAALRETARALAPGALASADWREALQSRDVDAVLIALPTSLHAEAAIAALGAGKHIYLEKPIAATLVDGKRVVDAWRSSKCIAATGFNYRYHPLIAALRQQIQSGRIGEVTAVRCTFSTADDEIPEWKRSLTTGGGVLLDLASHHIDLLRHLLSAEVLSTSARILSSRSDGDTATVDLQLRGNIPAHLFSSFRSVDENRIEIFGRQGKLSVDCYRSVDVEYSAPRQAGALAEVLKQSTTMVRRAVATLSGSNMKRSYRRSLDAFVSAVGDGRQAECDLNAGLASLAVIDAAVRSSQSGGSVAMDVAPSRVARSAGESDLPALTVIAITMDCYESLRMTVRHLAAQTIHRQIELLISGPSPQQLQLDERDMEPFHSFQLIDLGAIPTISEARVPGVLAARAPVVVFAEDHSFPEPTWAAELVAALALGAAAAGPQIRNANPQSIMSWADLFLSFGAWVEPRQPGPVERLPWHNSAYDREVLLSLGSEMQALIENEGLLHERLRAAGKQLMLLEARTRHVNVSLPFSFCKEHYYGGRAFGAGRVCAARWGLLQRLARIAGAPLVPLVRLRSTLNYVKQCGRGGELLPRMLPALLLGLCSHALGEAIGIAWGPGASGRRKSDLEFHRERHISGAEAMAVGFPAELLSRPATRV